MAGRSICERATAGGARNRKRYGRSWNHENLVMALCHAVREPYCWDEKTNNVLRVKIPSCCVAVISLVRCVGTEGRRNAAMLVSQCRRNARCVPQIGSALLRASARFRLRWQRAVPFPFPHYVYVVGASCRTPYFACRCCKGRMRRNAAR